MPLRWIEEAEARKVLAAALHDSPAPLPAPPAETGATLWREMVRRWLLASEEAEPGQNSRPEPLPALTVIYAGPPRRELLPEEESLCRDVAGDR